MPRLNKHLDDKWVKHCQNLHKQKLEHMKAAIDNKPPPRSDRIFFRSNDGAILTYDFRYIHLAQNLKKQQMEEERYSKIERDNYLLLDKMSYIMTHPQLLDEKYMGAPVTFGKSLNKEHRKRELMRITEENLHILKRIQHKEPYYSHLEWEEKARRDEEYLKNCAEYPLVLPTVRDSSARRPNELKFTAPSLVQPTPAPLQVRIKEGKGQQLAAPAISVDDVAVRPESSSDRKTMPKVEEVHDEDGEEVQEDSVQD